MSAFFIFRFNERSFDTSQTMAVFCFSSIDLHLLTKEIKKDIEKNLVPSNVLIFGFNIDKKQKSTLLDDDLFNEEFESFVGPSEDKIIFLNIDNNGKLTDLTTNNEYKYRHELLQSGANEIFKKRKGIISSTPNYHFSKPSGDHCDKFIRASNLFTSSIEVMFLAIGLLDSITSNIKKVYVDTSSISFLVSTALHLSNKFNTNIPMIESFESYAWLNQPFNFIRDDDHLVIISATTSGGLSKTLERKKKLLQKNIKTIFYSFISEGQTGLYNITGALGGEIYSESESRCNLCANGSRPIRLEGEQFFPETPKHDLLMIKKVDFKFERKNFIKEFAAKKILNINTKNNDKFYDINVPELIKNIPDSFSQDIEIKINKYFSRNTNIIIHLNDQGSELLALKIKELIGDDSIKILNFDEMNDSDCDKRSSVFVVTGAIVTGRKLLSVSRKLRFLGNSSSISYLVGFSKLKNTQTLKQLQSDLCMGGHELIILRNCFLPRIYNNSKTYWDLEYDKISLFEDTDPFNDYHGHLPQELKNRLELLKSPLSSDDLFLKDIKGDILRLRETFVFWDKLDIKINHSSQADVFWTIQTLLHDLRIDDGKGLSTTYHCTLISPICFDRYNDGIIQACLLRSAHSSELNYTIDENYSQQMFDIISSIIKNHNNEQGEGCLEFLMSLWLKHLKISDHHLRDIISLRTNDMPDIIKFLLDQIDNDLPNVD